MSFMRNDEQQRHGFPPRQANETSSDRCFWGGDEAGFQYLTGCGHNFYFDSGDVCEDGFDYCPYCGKTIITKFPKESNLQEDN